VRGLLRALDAGWRAYLSTVGALSAAETQAYLAKQGYAHVHDLLALATAWCEETLGIVSVLLRGGKIQRSDDDQAFNVQAIARFSQYADVVVARRFTEAYAALSRLLAFLPDAALAHMAIYDCLVTTIVVRFNQHRPPNMRAVP
jgi:hypothetical protein